jgi:hypothetical protein
MQRVRLREHVVGQLPLEAVMCLLFATIYRALLLLKYFVFDFIFNTDALDKYCTFSAY